MRWQASHPPIPLYAAAKVATCTCGADTGRVRVFTLDPCRLNQLLNTILQAVRPCPHLSHHGGITGRNQCPGPPGLANRQMVSCLETLTMCSGSAVCVGGRVECSGLGTPTQPSGCYQLRPAKMLGAQHALSSCDHQVCAGKWSGSLNAPIRRGAAGGTHTPLQSDKINFQEAKTTREDRTRPRAVDLRRVEIHYRHRSLLVPGPLPGAPVWALRPRAGEGWI